MRLTERIKNNRRSAARLCASVRRRAACGLTGAGQWAAGKPVSGAQACAADRTTSGPFVRCLSQSIVRATDRKAGCGRTACPVWMGRDVVTRFLSISFRAVAATLVVLARCGPTVLGRPCAHSD